MASDNITLSIAPFGHTLTADRQTVNYELLALINGREHYLGEEDGHCGLEPDEVKQLYLQHRDECNLLTAGLLERMLQGEDVCYGMRGSFMLEADLSGSGFVVSDDISDSVVAWIPYPRYALPEIAAIVNDWGFCIHQPNTIQGPGIESMWD